MSRKIALGVNLLEGRDCPSTVNIVNGTLTVTGTDGNDTITLRHTATTIIVDGTSYSNAGINRIVVSAGEGDDVIRDGSGYGAFLYGGDGDDTIYGNGGNDKLYGSSGDDKLYGGADNDIIWGGGGTDIVDGGAGVNTVNEGSPVRVQANSSIETQIIQLVNVERAKVGLPALTVSNALNYAARLHTQDMAALSPVLGGAEAMQHTLYGTARPEIPNRLDLAGYDTWTSSFSYGENIAYGFTSAATVMTGWMNSPGHRANILNANFSEIGVSVVADATGGLYFTQDFGKQT
ncbi:MAG: hypothetical protein K8U57_10420 [Planctomycetes bacterium]|nr:hypothetical protein [Planctomycetota bacterium]